MTAATEPSCVRSEHVLEYALQCLMPSERASLEAHLKECPACRRELGAVEGVVGALVDWPTDVVRAPAALWDRVSERIGEETGKKTSPEPLGRWEEAPRWREVAPGISCKMLSTDALTGQVSLLVHLEPGVAYPPHEHAGLEELFLLEGELWIEDRKLFPGDFSRAEAGSADCRVFSETGCTCVLITSHHDLLG